MAVMGTQGKPLVYVAGPITSSPMQHTHEAVHLTRRFIRDGIIVPFCPHYSVMADMIAPMEYIEWIEYDRNIIDHCDAVYRMVGPSAGADSEVVYAMKRSKIEVFCETPTVERESAIAVMYTWAKAL